MFDDFFDEMRKLQKEINKNFEGFFSKSGIGKEFMKPLTKEIIKEDGNNLVIKVDTPGLEKENSILKVTEDNIEVKGSKKREAEVKKKGYYKKEREYKGYYRMISLPVKINPDSAKANFSKGVLTIEVEKAKKKAVKEIKVR